MYSRECHGSEELYLLRPDASLRDRSCCAKLMTWISAGSAVPFPVVYMQELTVVHLLLCVALCFIGLPASAPVVNLLTNGDFEQSDARNPRLIPGWQPARQAYEIVTLADRHRKVLRFILSTEVARYEGVHFFSNRVKIERDKTYVCRAEILTNGPRVVMAVNGYNRVGDKETRVFRRQVRSGNKIVPGQWSELKFTFSPDQPNPKFHPVLEQKRNRYGTVQSVDVEFFAFGSEGGVLLVDNVKIEPAGIAASTQASTHPTRPAASGPVR